MAFPSEQDIAETLGPTVEQHGFDTESVTVKKAGPHSAVEITIDGDTPPDLDALEALSRLLSEVLDDAEKAGRLDFGSQAYQLTVSTPGVDTPLTRARHWRRNRGRLVEIRGVDGMPDTLARIGATSDDGDQVVLINPRPAGGGKGKKKKKNKSGSASQASPVGAAGTNVEHFSLNRLSAQSRAVVQVEFNPACETEAELARLDFDALGADK
ncbi:ribosome maturation factor RimP [Corynebacterium mendelii]|uniref:Ribosome maturation factor RimP n=1 Tax=Corynebacterium mendelii TaxID=2765362 RepID=A0A939IWQ1_9CORY|nr:ribosome maturation factor RimP [Corynebacterium mendelii]MBN9643268.1 ribosome maturation factor RimP [Corynebacterium mendelii]